MIDSERKRFEDRLAKVERRVAELEKWSLRNWMVDDAGEPIAQREADQKVK